MHNLPCVLALVLIAFCAMVTPASAGTPAEPPPGTRVPLTKGTLFIPEGTKAAADGVDVLIHLKGQGTSAERSFLALERPGVLVWFWDPGLSKVYTAHFAEGKALQTMLDETSAQLKQRGLGDGTIRRVTVASFSAGYAAVRQCLKQEVLFKRIDALVLSDTIYAGFIGDPAERKVDPKDMEGFVKFARAAAEGRKVMLLAHSAEPVDGYASTTDTSNYILQELGLSRTAVDEDWGDGLHLKSTAQKGKFFCYGFGANTENSHTLFLKYIGKFYKKLPQ